MIYPVHTDFGGYRAYGTKRNGDLYSGLYYHLGYDFNVDAGTSVRSISKGTVEFAGMMNGFGSLNPSTEGGCVIIKHEINNEIYFGVYGHLDNIQVIVGDYVVETDYLGDVNRFKNGGVELTHCHFGLFKGGRTPLSHLGYDKSLRNSINPLPFFKEHKATWFK